MAERPFSDGGLKMGMPVSYFLVTTFLVSPIVAFASGVPDSIPLTKERSEQLGFRFEGDVQSVDGSEMMIVTAHFPEALESGCEVGRIQSALFGSEDEQLSVSSLDQESSEGEQSFLVGYQRGRFDMGLSFQYCCQGGEQLGCEYSYTIRSLNEYLGDENGQ